MSIMLELIYKELSGTMNDALRQVLRDTKLDFNEIAQTKAISALSEIQEVIQNDEYDVFEVVERIVCIFEKYKISAGVRHDF